MTVARFSPSGYKIAVGDTQGTVRILDLPSLTISPPSPSSPQIITTKSTFQLLSGRINDIAWDADSVRIIAVGDGRGRFGACITADTGNTVGEISGHSAKINCVSIRQQRPIRAVTGADEATVVFHQGVPFKYVNGIKGRHERWVWDCRYSPDGEWFVSCGSDGRIWLYEGKTGEGGKEVGKGIYKGSVLGVAWRKDSKAFVTVGADGNIRIWNVESGENITTWNMAGQVKSVEVVQQLGVVWPKEDLIITVNLAGHFTYLQPGKDEAVKVVIGHQAGVTASAYTIGDGTLITGGSDGRCLSWNVSTGEAINIDGKAQGVYVSGLAAVSKGIVQSIGWDDSLRNINIADKSFHGEAIKTDGQPIAIATTAFDGKTYTIIATVSTLSIYSSGQKKFSETMKHKPTCLAVSQSTIAVGTEENLTRIYALGEDKLRPITELEHAGIIPSSLAFTNSSSNPMLAVGLANGKITVYGKTEKSPWDVITNRWSAHTAKVTCISWSPDDKCAVSGGLDTHIYLWSLSNQGRRVKASSAHKDGVTSLCWTEDAKVISTGSDAAVKSWKIIV